MRINRRVAVGMTYLVLAGCGGGDKPKPIARPAPSAAVSDAPAAAAGGPCLQEPVRLESKDVPYVVANFRESFTGPVIEVGPNDYPNCKVAKIRVAVGITADDLSALGRNWTLNFNRYGTAAVMNRLIYQPSNLSGSQLGSSCGSLVFGHGEGPEFVGREPPYDGTYGPRGGRSFEGFIAKPAAGKYTLYSTDLQAPLTITCYAVEIEFQQD